MVEVAMRSATAISTPTVDFVLFESTRAYIEKMATRFFEEDLKDPAFRRYLQEIAGRDYKISRRRLRPRARRRRRRASTRSRAT